MPAVLKVFLLAACLLGSKPAFAQTDIEYRGHVQSDLRASIPGNDKPSDSPEYAFGRTDNLAQFVASFTWGSVQAVADMALVFSGRSEVQGMEDLQSRPKVDPYYLESDSLYVEVSDVVVEGIDIRLGRQIIKWGTADMFNPTSVLNGYDLEDPLDFGRQVANEMVVVNISPDWMVEGDEAPIFAEPTLMLVAIPKFRSGLIPDSALLVFSEPSQFGRFVRSPLINNLIDVQEKFLEKGGAVVYDVNVKEPEALLENTQLGGRLSFTLLGLDLGVMAYKGYDHNTQPGRDFVTDDGLFGLFDDFEDTLRNDIEGLMKLLDLPGIVGPGITIATEITLVYPEVRVVGADLSTSIDMLGGLGLWAEFAMTYHDGVNMDLIIGDVMESEEVQVRPGKFWKLTAGMDYTITKWWYLNVQYLHGFIDEFGSEFLSDYIVAGSDFKTFDEQVLLRLFGIIQVQDESFIVFPQLAFKFWQNTELVAGALLHGGDKDSKFGNRTAGANTIFVKGLYAF